MGGRLKCPICETPLLLESRHQQNEWICPVPSCGTKVITPDPQDRAKENAPTARQWKRSR